ncbi:hypothetical protein GW17_00010188 [Ensete ventricosum]|nr:hypothetical protein GW17_00010188 [Ensete ventricosum]
MCFRWAFIDLSAGPFSWGPAVGGEGVRTELSLPNVGKTVGAVADRYADHSLPGGTVDLAPLETSMAFVAFFAEGRRCLLPSASSPITIDEETETVFFSSSEATRRRGGDVA